MSDRARGDGPDGAWEITDHTADMGIRVTARDWEGLLRTAARGMTACIGDLRPARGAGEEVVPVSIRAATRADQLRDWLAEILYHVDQRRAMLADIRHLRTRPDGVEAELIFMAYDTQASVMSRELKAVTYHQLRVDESADGFVANVIFDI